ncbi:FGF1 intracellular binding protein [Rhinolophus ferrumequinum]|uniref:FGF1 intracellular binding protein n=1 Tax=Rhinolophus ferrumequinum TaxID=59479 RepID=A0A7J7W6K4_RHIFE|nr:FGF1 intracellular binding protein [Rhinolophus ferrumequinum]
MYGGGGWNPWRDSEVGRAGSDASAHSPVNDAVALRVRSGILEQTGATAAVLQSDTMDHYRTFHMLERLLHAPPKLLHQLIFQIPPSRQALLIERDYAAIVFFANNRFETGKKKLQYLSFGDFAFCAELMIQNWTLGAVDSQVDDMDVDLDKEFLQDLKELKVLVADKDLLDLHKSLVCTALRGKLGVFSEMEANFKNLSRGLVNVAAKLTHNKDVRDLFVDLVEKFVEPCRSDHWPLNDVRLFLNQYSASVHSLDGFRHQALWDRYMGTLRGCLLRLYHD